MLRVDIRAPMCAIASGLASTAVLDSFPFADGSLRKRTATSFLPFVSNRSAIWNKKSFELSGASFRSCVHSSYVGNHCSWGAHPRNNLRNLQWELNISQTLDAPGRSFHFLLKRWRIFRDMWCSRNLGIDGNEIGRGSVSKVYWRTVQSSRNATFPVESSCRTHPRAHISTLLVNSASSPKSSGGR